MIFQAGREIPFLQKRPIKPQFCIHRLRSDLARRRGEVRENLREIRQRLSNIERGVPEFWRLFWWRPDQFQKSMVLEPAIPLNNRQEQKHYVKARSWDVQQAATQVNEQRRERIAAGHTALLRLFRPPESAGDPPRHSLLRDLLVRI